MAGKKTEETDNLTIAVEQKPEEDKGPMVTIFLPEILGAGDDVKVDQFEHVTIANELGEKHCKVLRGKPVEVPVDIYLVLKEKYGKQI